MREVLPVRRVYKAHRARMEQLAPLALPVKMVPQALPARPARRGLLEKMAV